LSHLTAALYGRDDDTLLAWQRFCAQAADALRTLAAISPSSLALTKQQFYQLEGTRFEDGIRLGADVNAVSRTSPEFRTALSAFLKK